MTFAVSDLPGNAALSIDRLPVNVAILSRQGIVLQVNQNWIDFARSNGLETANFGIGAKYIDYISGSDADLVRARFADLLEGRSRLFSHFYPCHSPGVQRWFFLIGRPASMGAEVFHVDVTPLVDHWLGDSDNSLPMPALVSNGILEGVARVVEATVARTMEGILAANRAATGTSATNGGQLPAVEELSMLSARQRQVLALLAHGKSNEEIAAELSSSVNTVKLHVSAVLRRLNLRSRTQAAIFATRILQRLQG